MEEAELSCPFVTTKSNSSIATACYNLEYKWSRTISESFERCSFIISSVDVDTSHGHRLITKLLIKKYIIKQQCTFDGQLGGRN